MSGWTTAIDRRIGDKARVICGLLLALSLWVGCTAPGADQLVETLDRELSVSETNTGNDSLRADRRVVREPELIPIGLIGPGFAASDVFASACDLSEDSYDRCL